jgi:hypothetical protein
MTQEEKERPKVPSRESANEVRVAWRVLVAWNCSFQRYSGRSPWMQTTIMTSNTSSKEERGLLPSRDNKLTLVLQANKDSSQRRKRKIDSEELWLRNRSQEVNPVGCPSPETRLWISNGIHLWKNLFLCLFTCQILGICRHLKCPSRVLSWVSCFFSFEKC